MKKLILIIFVASLFSQNDYRKSIAVDVYNIALGFIPLQFSLLYGANNEINIPLYYQIINKGSIITNYTGVKRIFITGINWRNHFLWRHHKFFWGMGSRVYSFIDNPKDSMFGKYYKNDPQDSHNIFFTIEPELGSSWILSDRVGIKHSFGLGIALIGFIDGEYMTILRPIGHMTLEVGYKF